MFEETVERMILYQCKFRAFLGLFTTSNHFWAPAVFGPDLVGQYTTLNWLHNSTFVLRKRL